MAKIVELIYTREVRGLGIPGDPSRRVDQLFTKSGELVAEYDPCDEKQAIQFSLSDIE